MEPRVEQHDILFILRLLIVQVLVGKVVINAEELLNVLPSLHIVGLQVGKLELLELV